MIFFIGKANDPKTAIEYMVMLGGSDLRLIEIRDVYVKR